jgi:hypothetical protein
MKRQCSNCKYSTYGTDTDYICQCPEWYFDCESRGAWYVDADDTCECYQSDSED